jgi:hypothetical protein
MQSENQASGRPAGVKVTRIICITVTLQTQSITKADTKPCGAPQQSPSGRLMSASDCMVCFGVDVVDCTTASESVYYVVIVEWRLKSTLEYS